MKPKIKVLVFDLGGVLVHGGYLDFIKHYCHACLAPQGQRKILALEREVNLGQISENKFYREIEQVFGVHLAPQQMHNLIVHKIRQDKALVKLLPTLGKTRVAMFTNSIGHMAREAIKRAHIPARRLFRQVFISSTLHLVKPDAKAYHYILKKLGVRPNEALLVDDRVLNIEGAKKIGMHGIVYKNSLQFKKAVRKYQLI